MTLVYLGLAWLLGIYCSELLRPSATFLALAFSSALILLLLWRRERTPRLAAFCSICLLAGAWRYSITVPQFGPSDLATYNDRGQATVRGLVEAEPDRRDTYVNLRLSVESLSFPDGTEREVHGLALVNVPLYPEYRYGDRLQVTGKLETPPVFETFSYRDYLARRGVYTLVRWPRRVEMLAHGEGDRFWAALYSFREQAQEVIARLVPEPQAALLTGILLGVETGIPRDLYEQFNATGTSHIIVISGSNIALVVSLLMALGRRVVGRRWAALLSVVGVILYTLLVGADASVVRAAIMGSLAALSLYLGRQTTALNSLMVSAIALTAFNPAALWDLGFQLSFAASFGLVLLVPLLSKVGLLNYRRGDGWAQAAWDSIGEVLLITVAVQIAVAPIQVVNFGRLSLVSLLANLLIVPVQPLVMFGGAIATAVGLIPFLTPLAQVLFWIPWLALAYTTSVVQLAARFPFATVEVGRFPVWAAALYYGAALAVVWLCQRKPAAWRELWERITGRREPVAADQPAEKAHPRASLRSVAPAGLLAVTVVLAWSAVLYRPDGRLHVAFLDVGQGDAIFVTTPAGEQILVDGGPSPTALLGSLGKQMPFWDRSIDLLILTHPDSDHLNGLPDLLERYRVGLVLQAAGLEEDGPAYEQWRELIARQGIPLQGVSAGARIETGDGLTLEVLNPPVGAEGGKMNDNDSSVVVRLVSGRVSFLLTGDAGEQAEGWMLSSGRSLGSVVLKVSHHGSDGASSTPFLEAVRPQLAVISVGEGNRFGHPAPGVLERLGAVGAQVFRTDEQGTVEVATDGLGLWVKTER